MGSSTKLESTEQKQAVLSIWLIAGMEAES
jgi:hypothetical protein